MTAQWGATYPVRYGYDAQGRMVEMHTYRSENGDAGAPPANGGDITCWLYDAPTGLLTNKLYADGLGTAYTYTPDGKLETRLWARGIATSYSYTPFSGELVSIDYSDDTPDIAYTYNRLGQALSAISSVSTNRFTYSPDTLELCSETQNGVVITRANDTLGRESGISLDDDYSVTYGYDDLGRFSSVSSSVCSVSSVVNYSRLPSTDLISGYTAGSLTVTKTFEPHRALITQIRNETPLGIISQYDYTNDALGRRVARQDSGLAFAQSQANTFGYNHRSEVTSAVMHTNTYGYAFDPIGNRVSATENAKTTEYLSNELNQYSQISAPSVSLREPTYDIDGNMTFDGREWHYTWNAENRMVLASNAAHTVAYAYDHQGRMVLKDIFDVSNNYKLTTINYVWDNWNIIAEQSISPIPNSLLLITNCTQYAWGLDLSDTLQGAGGVGGLLGVIRDDGTFAPTYDANGNITEYVSQTTDHDPLTTSPIAAHYEYDPFGNTAAQSCPLVETFMHRFSTKPRCEITGIVHFELRSSRSSLGCWMNRDPAEEQGGLNLYVFCVNDSINKNDKLGLDTIDEEGRVAIATFTEMVLSAMLGAQTLLLDEQGKVYQKIVAEMKGLVKKDILKNLKGRKCCEPSGFWIDKHITKLHSYGGNLFTITWPWKWGPLNYNFYTIGNMHNDIIYKGGVGTAPALWGTLCCYSAKISMTAKITDTFDFRPDRPNNNWKDKKYNDIASAFGYIFYDVIGASMPSIEKTLHESWEIEGCY